MTMETRWVAIAPCRNEEDFLARSLDSVVAQTARPTLLLVVDDGSSDATPRILADYAARHPWIRVVRRADRGHRSVGPGVMEAFHHGLDQVDLDDFEFLCKLDLDLDLPPRYFARLIEMMQADPRLGSISGKPFIRVNGRLIDEDNGDDLSVGQTKFYRTTCYRDIGGFTRTLLWDAIDCHRARQRGWRVGSRDEPELRFEHLRVMGSSHKGVLTGRQRYGRSQYFMGTDPIYLLSSAILRMRNPPYVTGSLAMLYGYMRAMIEGMERFPDAELRAFIRRYHRRVMRVGKARAVAEFEASHAPRWSAAAPADPAPRAAMMGVARQEV